VHLVGFIVRDVYILLKINSLFYCLSCFLFVLFLFHYSEPDGCFMLKMYSDVYDGVTIPS